MNGESSNENPPRKTRIWRRILRLVAVLVLVSIIAGCSCRLGIEMGAMREEWQNAVVLKAGVDEVVASDPAFHNIVCQVTSSRKIYIGGTLRADQRKRFIEAVIRQVGEIHLEQFTFNFTRQ